MFPDVFAYLDYRKYLRDAIAARRSASTHHAQFSLERVGAT